MALSVDLVMKVCTPRLFASRIPNVDNGSGDEASSGKLNASLRRLYQ
ncbi:MAG: hypothetical protein ACTXOO_00440 [Sodalis sp. (in: enterobacteria)]